MIVQESLVSLAAAEIRRMVITGEIGPGGKLNEPPLAERLGISRPPLREALRMLAAEGVLEQTPRRGYRVVQMSEQDIEEIYSLRQALENFALTLIEARRDPSLFDPLEPVMTRMRAAAQEGDQHGVVAANVDFHVGVVAAAGHTRLLQVYRALMVQMQMSMAANIVTEARSAGDLRQGCERHERLLAVLRAGDPSAVRRELALHGERDHLRVTAGDGARMTATGAAQAYDRVGPRR